jgi:hypothetical protein
VRCVVVLIDRRGIGANERGRLLAMRPVWIVAARTERCPALRKAITGDGSARLRVLNEGSRVWGASSRRCCAYPRDVPSLFSVGAAA